MGEVTEQIDEMLKMYDSGGITEDVEEVIDEPSDDVQEDIVEDVEEIQETEEVQEPPTEPAPEDELTAIKRSNEELKSKLDEILSRPAKPEPIIEEPEPITEQDFFEGADIDDIINDPKKFNALLNKVFLKGIEVANRKQEELRRTLPTTISETVTTVESLRKKSEKFYADNVDLVPFKGAVATVFNEIALANPSLDYDKLLSLSEVETRKRLNLTKSTKQQETVDKKEVPSLPRKKSQQRVTPPTKSSDPLTADIDAMNAVLYK